MQDCELLREKLHKTRGIRPLDSSVVPWVLKGLVRNSRLAAQHDLDRLPVDCIYFAIVYGYDR